MVKIDWGDLYEKLVSGIKKKDKELENPFHSRSAVINSGDQCTDSISLTSAWSLVIWSMPIDPFIQLVLEIIAFTMKILFMVQL